MSAAVVRALAEPELATTTLDVVIPVYNEEDEPRAPCSGSATSWPAAVEPPHHIADNASTDGTGRPGPRLATAFDDVRVVHLAEKGAAGR
jgi:hypothetical protein